MVVAALTMTSLPLTSAAAFQNPYGHLPTNATAGDRMFAAYFQAEARQRQASCLTDVRTLEDWRARQARLRRQLAEMLGLEPEPPRTDLHATITGRLDQPEFIVEKLHFQSRPRLYVTGSLYLPKGLAKPAPTILYLCGHALVKTNGVSYGCKVAYQHHGIWFARHGYVCLVLDTVELGEIEGHHHGTYREGRWWWNSRGYTSAGAEAWNAIRALDYLETRPEVDKTRFGVTGRSGGGAYSWWVAALDPRIQVACPVAGITDLQNHVVDGTVEGHCDCMFMVNTYGWDYPEVAALVAPRPLLIANTDQDTIFPLDGVVRLQEKVRRIYELYGASARLGLVITTGPHHDTEELQVPVFRWFNRFLQGDERPVDGIAEPRFTGPELKVFDRLPADEITRRCDAEFTRLAEDSRPLEPSRALAELRQKTFGGWPAAAGRVAPRVVATAEHAGVRLAVLTFESQAGVPLRLYVAQPTGTTPTAAELVVADPTEWRRRLALAGPAFAPALTDELAAAGLATNPPSAEEPAAGLAAWGQRLRDERLMSITFAPRGVGLTALTPAEPYQTQVRRRFMLLGQTLAGMQVWDVRRAVQAVRDWTAPDTRPLHLRASREMSEVAAFAVLFEPGIATLTLAGPVRADQQAPDFLNWSRIVTPDQLLSLAQGRCAVTVAESH